MQLSYTIHPQSDVIRGKRRTPCKAQVSQLSVGEDESDTWSERTRRLPGYISFLHLIVTRNTADLTTTIALYNSITVRHTSPSFAREQ